MIKINNLTKKFTGVKGIFDVNLQLEKGNIYGLLGPNASGKSTLIKSIVGVYLPTKGTIEVDNESKRDIRKTKISYMPDMLDFPNTKLIDIVNLHNNLLEDFSKVRLDQLLAQFNIDLSLKFKTLSKGQKMAFRLSLALAREVDYYILDEPLSGIDPVIRKMIITEIITSIDTTDKVLIISSHELNEIDLLIDYAILIKNGGVEGVYDIDEIRSETNLFDWYVDKFGSTV